MSEKTPSNKKDSTNEDEDFGLPKVKFTPIGIENKVPERGPVAPVVNQGTLKNPEKSTENAKGNGFLIVLLLLIIAIGLGSLYYFGFFESGRREVATQTEVPTPIEPVPNTPQVIEADKDIDVTEEVTTPQNILTEIRDRAAAPRYFVVVGSFIDDDLAKDYSSTLNKSGNPTFLIHPYGDVSYYRLAVAQYDNVKQALEVMEDKQGDYKENLWVLKY